VTFQRLIAAIGAGPLLVGAFLAVHAAAVVKTEHVEAELVSEKMAAQPGQPVAVG